MTLSAAEDAFMYLNNLSVKCDFSYMSSDSSKCISWPPDLIPVFLHTAKNELIDVDVLPLCAQGELFVHKIVKFFQLKKLMSSNTSFVAQQLRRNTILEAYFVKTSDMLLEFQLKSNMNDTTILTNFDGAKLYDKNNIHTKVRNLWNRNVLGLNLDLIKL